MRARARHTVAHTALQTKPARYACDFVQTINFDSPRGGISLVTEKGPETTSRLMIQKAVPSDSGHYTCEPSNANPSTIKVHVVNGEWKFTCAIRASYYCKTVSYFPAKPYFRGRSVPLFLSLFLFSSFFFFNFARSVDANIFLQFLTSSHSFTGFRQIEKKKDSKSERFYRNYNESRRNSRPPRLATRRKTR